jgi:hypothetical protein
MGISIQLLRQFGSKAGFEQVVHELRDAIHADIA